MSRRAPQPREIEPMVQPAVASAPVAPVPVIAPQLAHTPELVEKIRVRAYQLYLERGARDGYAEQDWLDAEAEILAAKNTLAA